MRWGRLALPSYGVVMTLVLVTVFCGDAVLGFDSFRPEVSTASVACVLLDVIGLWLFVGITSVSLRKCG